MLFNPLLVLLTTPAQIHSILKLAGPIGTTSLASRRDEWTPSLPPTFLTKIYLILSSRVLLEGSDYQKVLEGWASFLSSLSIRALRVYEIYQTPLIQFRLGRGNTRTSISVPTAKARPAGLLLQTTLLYFSVIKEFRRKNGSHVRLTNSKRILNSEPE
ncbi:hypothetical protein C8J57DRAFT_1219974 [Mycena rebaudengoi]|nr:hypothetical protein C8J57DRAFT_1219974 [Mycena rebaudengoi]